LRSAIAAELGEWARGYALDQQLSGAKARRELGWEPKHLDSGRGDRAAAVRARRRPHSGKRKAR
jgi:nucleoside-diphosphate-sugar epimerase